MTNIRWDNCPWNLSQLNCLHWPLSCDSPCCRTCWQRQQQLLRRRHLCRPHCSICHHRSRVHHQWLNNVVAANIYHTLMQHLDNAPASHFYIWHNFQWQSITGNFKKNDQNNGHNGVNVSIGFACAENSPLLWLLRLMMLLLLWIGKKHDVKLVVNCDPIGNVFNCH